MMNLEVHASSRGPTGESRGTPAPQHPVSQACVALHRQGCSGVSEPPAWALTPWEAVHSMVTSQPQSSPRQAHATSQEGTQLQGLSPVQPQQELAG